MQIDSSWRAFLGEEFEKPYMKELLEFLDREEAAGKVIYPAKDHILAAFHHTPFHQVKVVVIGQDPYHGEGQAHGLSFSVGEKISPPPSLVNIFKELETDLNIKRPSNGSLVHWANQGVLLLNSVLTVEHGKAGSHHKRGWEKFTDRVIEVLNEEKRNLVFILWGAPAQKKAAKVDESKHCLIKSPHPSPLSSYRGFFGSKPFSKANAYLQEHGISPIHWSV
jgi:uracil-DNA glycosylase